jgi:hypothetical protein
LTRKLAPPLIVSFAEHGDHRSTIDYRRPSAAATSSLAADDHPR